jgi:hypothetical protein
VIRNILCFLVGAAAAVVSLALLYLNNPDNVWLAVGVAGLIGSGSGLGLAVTWWALERYGLVTFARAATEVVLLATVAFAGLAFGGAPAWTWIVIEALAAAGLVLWAVRMMAERRLAWVKTPLNLLVLVLLLYVFLQLIPMPAGLLRGLQPNTVQTHVVSPLDAAPSRCPISVNRALTRDHLFLLVAYAAFFLTFINNVASRQQLGRMLAAVIVVSGVTAVAGFATYEQDERLLYRRWSMAGADDRSPILNSDASREFSGGYGFSLATQENRFIPVPERDRRGLPQSQEWEPDTTDFYVPKAHTGDVFGGFPSPNSAATVLVMGLVLSIGVFFAYVSTWRAEWGQSGGLLFTREGNLTLILAFFVLAAAAGLVLTQSRGALAVALALVPTLLLLIAFSRSWLSGAVTVGVALLLVVAVAAVLLAPAVKIGDATLSPDGPEGAAHNRVASPVFTRLRETVGRAFESFESSVQGDMRLVMRQGARRIIAEYPLFGTGLGTFGDAYPGKKVAGADAYFAHCDVLQWWAETGLVGLALALAILGVVAWTVVVGYFRLKDRFFKRLLLAASLSAAAFLLHGLVDYPMAIPGCMILFVAVSASAVVIARDQVARHEGPEPI